VTKKHAFIFIFIASIDFVTDLPVIFEDVHCGSSIKSSIAI